MDAPNLTGTFLENCIRREISPRVTSPWLFFPTYIFIFEARALNEGRRKCENEEQITFTSGVPVTTVPCCVAAGVSWPPCGRRGKLGSLARQTGATGLPTPQALH